MIDRSEVVGSLRGAYKEAIAKGDPELAEAFDGLSEKQKALGLLQGKVLTAKGLGPLADVWAWWKLEYGKKDWYQELSYLDKLQILVMCLPLVAQTDEKAYRAAAKIFAQAQE